MHEPWIEKRAAELEGDQTHYEKWVGRALGRWCGKRDILVYPQIALYGYILDFYFPQLGLAIELDGQQHDAEKDAIRDRNLREKGVTVLRFPNPTNSLELNAILFKIAAEARYRENHRLKGGKF